MAMVNLLFSIYGRFRGTVLAGLFDSSPGNFWADFYYRNINQQESSPNPDCVGPLCLDRNLHHRETVHDMDATGWLSIPVVLIPIAVILVGSFPGTVGRNQFGPDPLQRNAAS